MPKNTSDNKADVIEIYVAIVSYSKADRTDIAYIGTDRNEAIDRLWEAYKEYYADDTPDNDKYTKKKFIAAAETNDSSAYLQYSTSHINFELHKSTAEINTDAHIVTQKPDI